MLRKKTPPHPGEILAREFVELQNIKPHKLAKDLGWTYGKLEKLMEGDMVITPTIAIELGEVLDIEPDFWVKLQSDWDEFHNENN